MAKSRISPSQVLDLSQLVDYQEGSIVSRQIMKTPAGSVTLFAFDAGEQLSEHTTPFDALVQLVDGQAEIRIAGNSSVLRAGEIIVMPASIPHAVFAPSRVKIILTKLQT
ncbi:MAG: cupin domain-containing protein, partial [Anaerolineales bacterium]